MNGVRKKRVYEIADQLAALMEELCAICGDEEYDRDNLSDGMHNERDAWVGVLNSAGERIYEATAAIWGI